MSLPGNPYPADPAGPALVHWHLPEPLPPEPMAMAAAWLDEAFEKKIQPNPNAMTLATVDAHCQPNARIVLCKSIEVAAGYVTFFTNYTSAKADALAANPRAALLFHWDALARQVRIEGPVTQSPPADCDEYFATRPWGRKVAAWASEQSRPIESRDALQDKLEAAMRKFGLDPSEPPDPNDNLVQVPRPPHWGGYRVWAQRVELWAGSPVRLHDRAVWARKLVPATVDGAPGFRGDEAWTATRLQP